MDTITGYQKNLSPRLVIEAADLLQEIETDHPEYQHHTRYFSDTLRYYEGL